MMKVHVNGKSVTIVCNDVELEHIEAALQVFVSEYWGVVSDAEIDEFERMCVDIANCEVAE